MSGMKKLFDTIAEELAANKEPQAIADELRIPISWVFEVVDSLEEPSNDDYDDSLDGDHESALASAGWGTDEDYGYYGE